jgi:hypothetical protein
MSANHRLEIAMLHAVRASGANLKAHSSPSGLFHQTQNRSRVTVFDAGTMTNRLSSSSSPSLNAGPGVSFFSHGGAVVCLQRTHTKPQGVRHVAPHRSRRRPTFSSLSLLACGPENAAITEGDDELLEVEAALCSAKDIGGLTEGSVEANGVLAAANSLDAASLRQGAGLTTAAANGITRTRAGNDGTLGNGDDVKFTTLKQLSAVCNVGNSAIGKLLTYAVEHGLLGAELPFTACVGDLNPIELQGLFGRTTWLSLKAERYTRSCSENNGVKTCGAWTRGEIDSAPSAYGSALGQNNSFAATVNSASGMANIALKQTSSSAYWANATPGATTPSGTALSVTLQYRGFTNVCDAMGYGGGSGSGGCFRSHYEYWNGNWKTFTGNVTENCMRLSDTVEQSNKVSFGSGVESYIESVRTLSSAP